jgi:Domain of unknown function (DUF4365)
MTYPTVDENAFTERRGIIAVESATTDARCIWRETRMRDVGIDGQIEYVDPQGRATGRIVAVQVKSGSSYFERSTREHVPYTPPNRHRNYWREFPLPVILVLHDPGTAVTCWVDARAALRGGEKTVHVPKRQLLDSNGVLEALGADGPLPQAPLHARAVVKLMIAEREPLSHCDLTFFDLFVQGLTDHPMWSVYFSMDLYVGVAQMKQALLETEFGGLSIGSESFAFIDRYVSFLIAQDLARIDFDSFRRMADHAQMVGRILAPLTRRGLDLVEYVDAFDERMPSTWQSRVVRDRPMEMLLLELPERTARIEEFKRRVDAEDAQ